MGYKQSPTPSIEAEGGIVAHINNFFIKKGSPNRYGDVLRVHNMLVGAQPLSKQRAAAELGISRSTYIDWLNRIFRENHAADQTD